MIGYIKGKILSIKKDSKHTVQIILWPYTSHEAGVGYSVVTSELNASNYQAGDVAEFWIHFHSSENEIKLYGINSMEKMDLFNKILNVHGVGPKTALLLIDTFEPQELKEILLTKNANSLTKVPGLGKKTAITIIVTLGNQVEDLSFADNISTAKDNKWGEYAEQIALLHQTLQNLGYSANDAQYLINASHEELSNALQEKQPFEVLLKKVLKFVNTP